MCWGREGKLNRQKLHSDASRLRMAVLVTIFFRMTECPFRTDCTTEDETDQRDQDESERPQLKERA